MNLDEALAVYLYLQHAKDRSEVEQEDFETAWSVICKYAQATLIANGGRRSAKA